MGPVAGHHQPLVISKVFGPVPRSAPTTMTRLAKPETNWSARPSARVCSTSSSRTRLRCSVPWPPRTTPSSQSPPSCSACAQDLVEKDGETPHHPQGLVVASGGVVVSASTAQASVVAIVTSWQKRQGAGGRLRVTAAGPVRQTLHDVAFYN